MSTDDKDNSEDGNNSNVLLEDKVQTKKAIFISSFNYE